MTGAPRGGPPDGPPDREAHPAGAGGEGSDRPEVYLCQVAGPVSCGACCGLYNVPDLAREGLEGMLARRTAEFAGLPRRPRAIEAFEGRHRGPPREDRPFPDFHHCAFLGLVGRARGRVGCLLHPAAPGNDGVDHRWLSFYGERACRTYRCPTYRHLPPRFGRVVRSLADHWFAYGMIVTEHRLLSAWLGEVEARLGRPLDAGDAEGRPEAVAAFGSLASLRTDWPFRRPGSPGPCPRVFENAPDGRGPLSAWSRDGTLSRHAVAFRELDTAFSTAADREAAEDLLDRRIDRLVRSLRHPGEGGGEGPRTPSKTADDIRRPR